MIYVVRSYFENFDSSQWKTIGFFTDKNLAENIAKKWRNFFEEKKNILNEPDNWKPSEYDLEWSDGVWVESLQYDTLFEKYSDIIEFRDIVVEEFEMDIDRSLQDQYLTKDMLSLMTQWNRDYKINEINTQNPEFRKL